mgnify:CR=1 FL=1
MMRILLVDDNPDFLTAVSGLLSAQKYLKVVGRVPTGRQAIERARELKPDVVLMSITRPPTNCFEATRNIKQWNEAVRVIILSLYDDQEYRKRAEAAGADGFVVKSRFAEQILPLLQESDPGRKRFSRKFRRIKAL